MSNVWNMEKKSDWRLRQFTWKTYIKHIVSRIPKMEEKLLNHKKIKNKKNRNKKYYQKRIMHIKLHLMKDRFLWKKKNRHKIKGTTYERRKSY